MRDFKKYVRLKDLILKNFIKLSPQEKEMVRDWRNDRQIRKWMYSERIIGKREHRNFIDGLRNNKKKIYWLVQNAKTKEYLGVISLDRIDFENKNAFLGIYRCTSYRGSGVGHLFMNYLRELMFKTLKFHTLKLEVLENNSRALDFYKKEGFCVEGRLREFVLRDGKWLDVIIMGNEKR